MRKLIAGMQSSLDGKIEGAEGYADWVDAWSDNYELTPQIDAALLGAGMYPGYEEYWSGVQNAPDEPSVQTGKVPTPAEVEWARFAAGIPHYVLSTTLTSTAWAQTSFLRSLDEIAALKEQAGKDIYLVGGARTVASLIDAGLVDELRLTVHPLIVGDGKGLFATTQARHALELQGVKQLQDGQVSLIYGIALT
jgi:dihydrofolate reductase